MAEFDSSITAYFGGDVTGLQEAVTQSEQLVGRLDAKFAEMGVNWGQGPKILASESAKAFEEVYSAQKKVADFQEQVAYERMSTEEKLKVTQTQALAIREQALSIEGNSVEKQGLILQYNQKLKEIYNLNQQALKEQSDEQGKNVEQGSAFEKIAGNIKKAFKEIGIELKGAGIGIVFAEAVKLAKDSVQAAVEQRDAYEKMGKPIDNATRSMAMLGDGIKVVGKGLMDAVGFVVGGWAQIGDLLGSAINRMRGISEAQENHALQMERINKEHADYVARLQQEQHDIAKIADAKKAAIEQDKKAVFDLATGQQQLALLEQKKADLARQIQNTEQGTVLYYERIRQLSEATVATEQKRIELVKQSAEEQLQKLSTIGSLDVIYAEKRNTLTKEAEVLQNELNGLIKDSADYKAVVAKIDTNSAEQQKLSRQEMDDQVLDLQTRTELQRIALGISRQDVDAQSQYVAQADLQAQKKQVQFDIGQLQVKQLYEGLNPEEIKRLKTLMLQEDTLGRQAVKLKEAFDPEKRRNDLAQQWHTVSNDQLKVMDVQYEAMLNQATEQLKLSEAEGDQTQEQTQQVTLLKMQLDLVRKIRQEREADKPSPLNNFSGTQIGVAGGNFGGFVQGETTAALQGTIQKIMDKLNSQGSNGMLLKNATIQGNYGDFATASILKQQLDVAQKELELRANVSSFASRYGESAARSQFGDTVVQRALQDMQSSSDKIAAGVTAISRQLSASGLFPNRIG